MIYSLPFIAAAIGWFTNYIAIKLLFRPYKAINFGFFKIQGVFPKRQKQFAKDVANMVSEELLSGEEIKKLLLSDASKSGISKEIESKLDSIIERLFVNRLPWLNLLISDKKKKELKHSAQMHIEEQIPLIVDQVTETLNKDQAVQKMVEEKVLSLKVEEIESLLLRVISKELKFIELIGAVIGFLIGVVQVVLLKFF